MGMNLNGYLALIYVSKNTEKGQSVSEIYETYKRAVAELEQLTKDSESKGKSHVKARIVK